ncbi:hypothetical protein BOTBODRAFT_357474 [Botryobasidium botryosum FD-172 SS1]|uniref:Uncharacterized protein n=1 Tax=Botryobasidium botryosum (strain FD-172 SS1) TaxID=930990 RepID=A0A067MQZ5_BOTB1|nr:hypothetical protein BOTBODRAFT_357474 [Botryobasidium botryosum FD-172 SS1]
MGCLGSTCTFRGSVPHSPSRSISYERGVGVRAYCLATMASTHEKIDVLQTAPVVVHLPSASTGGRTGSGHPTRFLFGVTAVQPRSRSRFAISSSVMFLGANYLIPPLIDDSFIPTPFRRARRADRRKAQLSFFFAGSLRWFFSSKFELQPLFIDFAPPDSYSHAWRMVAKEEGSISREKSKRSTSPPSTSRDLMGRPQTLRWHNSRR